MTTSKQTSLFAGYRFPAEIIAHVVWLYFRFPLSLRMVDEMLAARGIVISHETVRQWALKFGRLFAAALRRRQPQAGDKWHLDEMVVAISGRKYWLWRAVDQHGVVLDILIQSRRNKKGAKRLMRKLLKKQGCAPRVMITDKLKSYGAAKREIMPGVEHRQHKGLNNRAENSHLPTRAASGSCRSSNHPDRPSNFSPFMSPSPTCSTSNAIRNPPLTSVLLETKRSRSGMISPTWTRLPDRSVAALTLSPFGPQVDNTITDIGLAH